MRNCSVTTNAYGDDVFWSPAGVEVTFDEPDVEPEPERTARGQLVAMDRVEEEPCQRGTEGCCVDHVDSSGECETW